MGAAQNGQNRKERDSAHGEPPDDITRLSRLLQPPQRPTTIRAMTAQATVIAPATQSECSTRKIGNRRTARAVDNEPSFDNKSNLNGLIPLQYQPATKAQIPPRARHKVTRRTRLRRSRVDRWTEGSLIVFGSFSFTGIADSGKSSAPRALWRGQVCGGVRSTV